MHNLSQETFSKFKQHLVSGADRLGICVSDEQVDMMLFHARQLLLWNKKINLTAIKDPLLVAEKHFVDCLGAVHLFEKNQTLMDMGSGGGFPGIPLKIMLPSLKILMVDSSRKKVNFIKDVIRGLNLENINAIHARVEDLQTDDQYKGQFDAVISRAFTQLSNFTDLALPFIKPDGCIHAMKGKHADEELTEGTTQNFNIISHAYQLPFEKSERQILSLSVKH